ncbi:hypothetical protein ACWFQ8_32760 [Streptomyces sp. NPDC055254]
MTVVHLPEEKLLHVGLQTTEPVQERTVRPGLTLAFAEDDPTGPPVRVRAVLPVPADVLQLLGGRCGEAVRRVFAGPERVAWVHLDLAEVESMALAWSPYRGAVLAPDSEGWLPQVGRWAEALWTLVRAPRPAVRSGLGAREERGEWWLPAELAAEGGVHPRLVWELRQGTDGLLTTVRASSVAATCRLEAAPDNGDVAWTPFTADAGAGEGEGEREVCAELTSSGVPATAAVRFRVRPETALPALEEEAAP